jgi:hypothetical protein
MRLFYLICACLVLSAQPSTSLALYDQTREGLVKAMDSGITRLDLVILPSGEARPNVYGEFAMGYGGQSHDDVSLPNPAFFQHLDWVIRKAASKKIQVRILAVQVDSKLMIMNPAEKWFEFGRYLGRRYMKAKNLVWLRTVEPSAGSLLSLEEGIRHFDSVHRFELIKQP